MDARSFGQCLAATWTCDDELCAALLAAEAGLREAIRRLDPGSDTDRPALKDLQESLGLVGGWRRALESGRWRGPKTAADASADGRR